VLPIHRILHPTDFSELSRPAFELGCSLARDNAAELVVPHVSPPPVAGVVEGITVELPTGWSEQARARLGQVRPTDPRVSVAHRLEEGDAAREILRVAGEVKAGLIVMGTHGRGGLSRVPVTTRCQSATPYRTRRGATGCRRRRARDQLESRVPERRGRNHGYCKELPRRSCTRPRPSSAGR
jgi:nucleotide-binding universal stress UspA family protein